MEKLLHERLQQYSTDDSSFGILDGTRISALYASETKAIADEIEHYYIPRPRFEDGKPVQFGDDIEHPDTGDKCVIQSINIFNDGKYCFALQGTAGSAHYMKDEFVKRPAPKVLDADGVEIKVGDTVYPTYGIYQGILSNVLDADDEAAILIDVGNSFEKYARTALTHELPVFDANGERICKGDTVLHVEEFVNRECGLVQCSNEEDGDCEDHDARRLTHREPDSLEKLRDDLYTLAARDDGDIEVEIVIFADRLTALIERGA